MEQEPVSQKLPLVSIICTVFNQEKTVEASLRSVFNQSYPSIELFVIDNGSSDSSIHVCQKVLEECPSTISFSIISYSNTENYCYSFNNVFRKTKGLYFIDLSGDDMLFPQHVEVSVKKLLEKPNAWAVFSNVELVNQVTKQTKLFYDCTLNSIVLEGDIYQSLVKGNPISSVSLVISSEKFRQEGFYDESLNYEDFDLMVRMSRKYPLFYTGEIGVKKNIHPFSFSSQQYQARQSKMLPSTYQVCRKILAMNRNEEEQEALKVRVMYELKMAAFSANFKVAKDLIGLAEELGIPSLQLLGYRLISQIQWDLSLVIEWKQRLWKS
ncbi:glycosyltransferase family A protein [Mongoliitalea lutea]|uniref:Glycosyltransferase 2-like domain-containing protein n=1 Tax=Mongoliitalea lutea TaxID=849756 RepID=A0A8J3G4Y0_9BACT|nr:glycosyltransferase family A protein [Mongoliitalea lutea]GHB33999.1 hypothetical protein GCM10008106_13920 [Mongoliitalea lutea]